MKTHKDIVLIDHIGVDLWTAAEAWKALYTNAMVQGGDDVFGGAGYAVLQFIGPHGARPIEIARKLGVSRQAVQQLIDMLIEDGIVTRDPDPRDRRAKIVRLTDIGAEAHWRGNRIKAQIEHTLIQALGTERVARMKEDLAAATQVLRSTDEIT